MTALRFVQCSMAILRLRCGADGNRLWGKKQTLMNHARKTDPGPASGHAAAGCKKALKLANFSLID
ncbi:hypothetical protein [Nitratireductor soli]|uniref:hypothetical protein n=1 Tax=Nitratireductor soli TaxID=1670619 RepID=UPI0012F94826|nr:hypothetical protein [Nitratireductor soli]